MDAHLLAMDVVSLILLPQRCSMVKPRDSPWMLHRFPPHASNMTYGIGRVEAWLPRRHGIMPKLPVFSAFVNDERLDDLDGAIDAAGALARWGGESAILVMSGLLTLGVMLPLFFVERELKQGSAFVTAQGGVHGTALVVLFPAVVVGVWCRSPTTVQNASAEKQACCPRWVGARPAPMCFCVWKTTNAITTSTGGWRWASTRSGGQSCCQAGNHVGGRRPSSGSQLVWERGTCARRVFQDDTLYRTGMVRNMTNGLRSGGSLWRGAQRPSICVCRQDRLPVGG